MVIKHLFVTLLAVTALIGTGANAAWGQSLIMVQPDGSINILGNGPQTYNPGVATNVTINSGAIINNPGGASGVMLGNGGTIDNEGVVTVNGGMSASGTALDIGFLNGTNPPTAAPGSGGIVNNGVVNITTPMNGTGLNVTVLGDGTVQNGPLATINVNAATGNATGVALNGAGDAALGNDGTVASVVANTGAGTGTATGAATTAGANAQLTIGNTGSLAGTATTANGVAAAIGLNAATGGGSDITNSGMIVATANATLSAGTGNATGVLLNANGTLGNVLTNSGAITATGTVNAAANTQGINVGTLASPLTINNTGTIGSTGYGIFINPGAGNAAVTINDNGGTITSGNGQAAIQLGTGANTVNLNNGATVNGLISGGAGGANGTLNVNIFGATPTQQAADQNALATANVNAGANPGGTQTITIGGQVYTVANFGTVSGNIVSLETSVDSGLGGIAVAIDINGGLPTALAPPNGGVGVNPEAYLNSLVGRQFLDTYATLGLGDAASFEEMADNRSFLIRHGSGGLDVSMLEVRPESMIASVGNDEALLERLGSSRIGGTEMSDTPNPSSLAPATVTGRPLSVWVAGTVDFVDESTRNSVSGYHGTTGSPTIGLDYRLNPDLVVGALVHGWTTGVNFDDGSRFGVQMIFAGPYVTWSHQGWYVNALAGGGYSSYDNDRVTPGGGTAQSSPDGNEIIANISGGYDFNVAGWQVSPIAGLNYTHLSISDYTENSAGAFNLAVGSQDIDSLRTKLGFHVTRSFRVGSVTIMPEIHASWWHELFDQDRNVQESLEGAPGLGDFSIGTLEPDQDFAMVGGGVSALFDNFTVFVGYNAQAGSQYLAHTVNGGVRIGF